MSFKSLKFVELLNGRAAMIGCSAVVLTAMTSKSVFISSIGSFNLNQIWWAIGIYSS